MGKSFSNTGIAITRPTALPSHSYAFPYLCAPQTFLLPELCRGLSACFTWHLHCWKRWEWTFLYPFGGAAYGKTFRAAVSPVIPQLSNVWTAATIRCPWLIDSATALWRFGMAITS